MDKCIMDGEGLFNLIKSETSLSDETINYIVANTGIAIAPIFLMNKDTNGECIKSDIKEYLSLFLKQECYRNILIKSGDIDTSNLLTKFKAGDSVWYFNKDLLRPVNYLIVEVNHDFNEYQINSQFISHIRYVKAQSFVAVKRILSNGELGPVTSHLTFTNDELFASKMDLLHMLMTGFIDN